MKKIITMTPSYNNYPTLFTLLMMIIIFTALLLQCGEAQVLNCTALAVETEKRCGPVLKPKAPIFKDSGFEQCCNSFRETFLGQNCSCAVGEAGKNALQQVLDQQTRLISQANELLQDTRLLSICDLIGKPLGPPVCGKINPSKCVSSLRQTISQCGKFVGKILINTVAEGNSPPPPPFQTTDCCYFLEELAAIRSTTTGDTCLCDILNNKISAPAADTLNFLTKIVKPSLGSLGFTCYMNHNKFKETC